MSWGQNLSNSSQKSHLPLANGLISGSSIFSNRLTRNKISIFNNRPTRNKIEYLQIAKVFNTLSPWTLYTPDKVHIVLYNNYRSYRYRYYKTRSLIVAMFCSFSSLFKVLDIMGQKQKQLNMTNGGGKVRFYVCTFVHIYNLRTLCIRRL